MLTIIGHEPNDQRKYDSRLESPGDRQDARGNRKYPNLPVPDQSRGREPTRESRNFINPSSWKIGSWTLSSPLNLRKFRTTSSDRTSTFDRNLRLQPGYRSLNERDKHVYTSSGKSDNLWRSDVTCLWHTRACCLQYNQCVIIKLTYCEGITPTTGYCGNVPSNTFNIQYFKNRCTWIKILKF